MSIIQVRGAGGQRANDRTLFVGSRTPSEIQAMIKPLSKLDKTLFSRILEVVINSLNGTLPCHEDLQLLKNDQLNEDTLIIIFAGLLKLLKQALKLSSSSLKKEHFLQDLHELQIPSEFHELLMSSVFGPQRKPIDEHLASSKPHLPSLTNLDWRVDVAISTGVLNRVLVRGVTLEMTLSDGSISNFETSVSTFQDLRFQVASVLNEMEKLEKRSILKITD